MRINLGFDKATLQRIESLALFNAILEPNLLDAHEKSLEDLQSGAESWMQASFHNSTGELEGSFERLVESPYTSKLINPSDYAWRRERGFSGMTDSLGRLFPDDPGIAYMEAAITLENLSVEENFREAVEQALIELGVL